MPLAKLWKTMPGSKMFVRVKPGENLLTCHMDIDITVLATQSSLYEEKSKAALAKGFTRTLDEGTVFTFNLIALPKNIKKKWTAKVEMVVKHKSGLVPTPDKRDYTFSSSTNIWTWKVF